MRKLGGMVIGLVVAGLASAASAATFQYGYGANNATANAAPAGGQAQAVFTLSGADLIVTLTNETTASVGNGAELTAVYWNSNTVGGTFTKVELGSGSFVLVNNDGVHYTSGTPLGADANSGQTGWYGFGNNINLDTGQQYALSSTGVTTWVTPTLALNGMKSTDPGAPSPNSPDGPAGGLVGSGGVSSNLYKFAVVQNSLVFTISNVGANFDLNTINNVQFQYNTSRATSSPVPVPAAAWMGLSSLAGLGLMRLRRKNRAN
jgi:hypothetical protein